MADLTNWARIEPHAATTDIDVGLAAQIADPMWLLARQLQLGEFTGDDGGSPASVELRASYARLTRFRPGLLTDDPGGAVDYYPTMQPLEALVEAERIDISRAWQVRVEAGQKLEQRLAAAGLGAAIPLLRAKCPFEAPASPQAGLQEERYAAIFTGRVTDGLTARQLTSGDLAEIRAASGNSDQLDTVLDEWDRWVAAEMPVSAKPAAGNPAWQQQRLEYGFAVSSPGLGAGDLTLAATEYDGTGLDWFDVDIAPGASLAGGPPPDEASGIKVPPRGGDVHYRLLPRSVSFAGMPADRFWEMEDGLIDLGSLDAGPTDLARLLAVESAVIYSPDWFVVPVELPIGSLAQVDWVVVTDTFGVATLVGTPATQAADNAGRMYQLSTVDAPVADVPLLFLPPAALYGMQSPPLEDMLLQRDEEANLAWAIEKTLLGAAGKPVTIKPGIPDPVPQVPAAANADLTYQLSTWVPQGWAPFVARPIEGTNGTRLMLQRAMLMESTSLTLRESSGQLAREIDQVFEEEVGRAGLRLQLVDQLVRWSDGSTHLWRGRQVKAGLGESHAGLYFDYTTPPKT